MSEPLGALLTTGDDRTACALTDQIIAESSESDKWYAYLADFAALLDHPKSLVRNRGLHLLAANARWDAQNQLDAILPAMLAHITDEKPITARQCIKALIRLGQAKPRYSPDILTALRQADLTRYRDSMRPLIAQDIAAALRLLGDAHQP